MATLVFVIDPPIRGMALRAAFCNHKDGRPKIHPNSTMWRIFMIKIHSLQNCVGEIVEMSANLHRKLENIG
jgi:hypothetical protein